MRQATHLQFQLGLDERWHVRALLVGVVQQVLQRALNAVEEAVQDNVVEVFDVLPPDVRVSLGSEQLPVLLHQSVDLLPVGLHLGVAATHIGRAKLQGGGRMYPRVHASSWKVSALSADLCLFDDNPGLLEKLMINTSAGS